MKLPKSANKLYTKFASLSWDREDPSDPASKLRLRYTVVLPSTIALKPEVSIGMITNQKELKEFLNLLKAEMRKTLI